MAACRLAVALWVLVFWAVGCSPDLETEIVGAWQGITPKQDLVFYEDGRVAMKGHHHGEYWGTYTIKVGKNLLCEFPRLSQPVECTARIRGDRLILAFSAGREEVYVRK
jgi:hypothetical protein